MKKKYITILPWILTTTFIAIQKLCAHNSSRTSFYFKYIGSNPKPATVHQVTNLANWTITLATNGFGCPGSLNPCMIVGTSKQTVFVSGTPHYRPSTIPSVIQTNASPAYYAPVDDQNFNVFNQNIL